VDAIELERELRDDAVERLRTYFDRERDEQLGELAAGLLYDFIAEQVGPYFYNKGIEDAQALVARFADSLDADLEAAKRLPPRSLPGER
jgi:uncharacterized protein (DUF2164 family)